MALNTAGAAGLVRHQRGVAQNQQRRLAVLAEGYINGWEAESSNVCEVLSILATRQPSRNGFTRSRRRTEVWRRHARS